MGAKRSAKTLSQETLDRARRLYETHQSSRIVAEILHVSQRAISSARLRGWKAGRRGMPARPMPDDFRIMANRLSKPELARHYKAGKASIALWVSQIDRNYTRKKVYRTLPIPADAKSYLSQYSRAAASKHYGVDKNTITKWKRVLGIPTKKVRKKATVMRGWAEQFSTLSRLDRTNQRAEHQVMAEPTRHHGTAA